MYGMDETIADMLEDEFVPLFLNLRIHMGSWDKVNEFLVNNGFDPFDPYYEDTSFRPRAYTYMGRDLAKLNRLMKDLMPVSYIDGNLLESLFDILKLTQVSDGIQLPNGGGYVKWSDKYYITNLRELIG